MSSRRISAELVESNQFLKRESRTVVSLVVKIAGDHFKYRVTHHSDEGRSIVLEDLNTGWTRRISNDELQAVRLAFSPTAFEQIGKRAARKPVRKKTEPKKRSQRPRGISGAVIELTSRTINKMIGSGPERVNRQFSIDMVHGQAGDVVNCKGKAYPLSREDVESAIRSLVKSGALTIVKAGRLRQPAIYKLAGSR